MPLSKEFIEDSISCWRVMSKYSCEYVSSRGDYRIESIQRHKVSNYQTVRHFLSEEPSRKIRLQLNSHDMDVEVISMTNREAFSLAHRKNGRFGFPNNFIETRLGVSATTRSWTTVKRIARDATTNSTIHLIK